MKHMMTVVFYHVKMKESVQILGMTLSVTVLMALVERTVVRLTDVLLK